MIQHLYSAVEVGLMGDAIAIVMTTADRRHHLHALARLAP